MSGFKIARETGFSDAEVLIDLVRSMNPGEILKYDDIAKALAQDSEREYDKRAVQGVVCRSEHKLAVSLSRALMNVQGEGYRIAPACEHQRIAGRKKERASKMLKRGLVVLKNVRWDEMDENQRQAHEGHLMVAAALSEAMSGIEQRLSRIEKAIQTRDQ